MNTQDELKEWPKELMLRDAKVYDDLGGLGQRIFTTAGVGEKVKYVRADLVQSRATHSDQAQPPTDELHPATADLVDRFADAMRDKLLASQRKYGYSDNWQRSDWTDECRQHLREHLEKGDPRDVAAYCAFLWHHGESTAQAQPPAASVWTLQEQIAWHRAEAARLTQQIIGDPRDSVTIAAQENP